MKISCSVFLYFKQILQRMICSHANFMLILCSCIKLVLVAVRARSDSLLVQRCFHVKNNFQLLMPIYKLSYQDLQHIHVFLLFLSFFYLQFIQPEYYTYSTVICLYFEREELAILMLFAKYLYQVTRNRNK